VTEEKTERTYSVTADSRCERHGVGLWGGSRKTTGIRVDEKLYKAFKPRAEAIFGSTCKAFECFMAAILACPQVTDSRGNTIKIDKIVIERRLRERRRLEFLEDDHCFADFYDVEAGGIWRRVKFENEWDLNENGHIVGCSCLLCKGKR